MLAQAASLFFTGILIWRSAVQPRLLFQPLAAIAAHALLFACLAWLFSALITLGLFLCLPGADRDRRVWSAFRTASVAVWFAPACILLSALSPATLVAALLLVVTATRLLYSEWEAARPAAPPATAAGQTGLFDGFTARRPAVTRELVTGIAAALALQSGGISVWRHRPLLAGACFALSAAITTLFAMVSGAAGQSSPPTLPRAAMGMAMTILLAAGLTFGGLGAARGRGGDGSGNGSAARSNGQGAAANARELLRDLFGDDESDGGHQNGMYPVKPPSPALPGITPDGSFPGVILLPEVRPTARLVEFPPRGLSSGTAPARPYGIPFDGPYLFFRWPARRPPPTSIVQRGSPAALAFSTTDRWPLTMQAVQKFDEPIDLSCCRAVRVEIWNADRYPGTVSLEFACNDKRIGVAPVRSTPDLNRDPPVAAPESLEFPVTSGGVCAEFRLTFRRDGSRGDKSARIAIERFVLEP